MAANFQLELYRPNTDYLIPNGGTTLQKLNFGAYGTCSVQTIDENLDLGSTLVNVTSSQSYKKYGNILQNYTRPDRSIKFSVLLFDDTGDNANLRAAIRYIQSIVSECNQYNTNLANANTSRNIGMPLMLKYQPVDAVEPVYFYVKYGVLNIGTYNDETNLNNTMAQVNFELTTSYAAYGNGIWLENIVPNGTFAYGLKGWGAYEQIPLSSNFQPLGTSVGLYSSRADMSQYGQIIPAAPETTYIDNKIFYDGSSNWNSIMERGYDELWGYTDSSNVFSEMIWKPYGQTNALIDTMARSDNASTMNTAVPLTGSPTNTFWQWFPQVGTWGIISNKAYSVSNNNGDLTLVSSSSDFAGNNSTDIVNIQVSMLGTLNSATNYSVPNLVFRYYNANRYMFARVYNGNVELWAVTGGVATRVANFIQSMADNTSYTLKVTLGGSGVTVSVNGSPKISYVDSSDTYKSHRSFYKAGFMLQKAGTPATAAKWSTFSVDSVYELVTSLDRVVSAGRYSLSVDYRDDSASNVPSITDYFNRGITSNVNLSASPIADTGQTWTVNSGIPILTKAVSGTNTYGVLSNSNVFITVATINAGTSDMYVDANVQGQLPSSTGSILIGHETGLIFRFSDINNYWTVTASGKASIGSMTVYLKKTVAGVTTTVSSADVASSSLFCNLRVRAIGSAIVVWYNDDDGAGYDSSLLNITDSFNSTATKAGVWFDAGSSRVINTLKTASFDAALIGMQRRAVGSGNWDITGEIFYLNNVSDWTNFRWENTTYFAGGVARVFIKLPKAGGATGVKHFRKVSLNHYPDNSIFYDYPSTVEYQSQPVDSADLAILTGLQGTMETNCRLSITNMARLYNITGSVSTDVVAYQQATIGMRKMIGFPVPFHQSLNHDLTGTLGVGATYSVFDSNNYLEILSGQIFDGQMRRYKVIVNISTNSAIGMSFSSDYTGVTPLFPLVPNQLIAEIPNTSSVYTYVEIGTFNLVPNNIKVSSITTASPFALRNGLPVRYNFNRTTNSIAGAISIGVREIWFVPADDINYIDTRSQLPASISSSNTTYNGVWYSNPNLSNSLVIDSLMTERVDIYLMATGEKLVDMFPLNASATNNIYRLFPSTPTSPEPMGIGTVIRRQGTSGNPATTVQPENISYSVLYCPAYEF